MYTMGLAHFFHARPTSSPIVYIAVRASIRNRTLRKMMRLCIGLQRQETQELHILLSSGGGSARCGIDLFYFLRSLPFDIKTYNVGFVGSVANAVFLAGQKRYAAPHAHFLFHASTKSFLEQEKLREHDLEKALEHLRTFQGTIQTIVLENTSMTKKVYDAYVQSEKLMSVEDAKRFGFIDAIKEPRIPSDCTVYQCLDGID